MLAIQVAGNELLCDPDATASGYAAWIPQECDCTSCANYRANRHALFTTACLAFFAQFGIDPIKPAEIYDVGPVEGSTPGMIQYGGWFHFIGEIVRLGENVALSPDLTVWFSRKIALAAASFTGPVVQLEIEARLPWVLEVPWET